MIHKYWTFYLNKFKLSGFILSATNRCNRLFMLFTIHKKLINKTIGSQFLYFLYLVFSQLLFLLFLCVASYHHLDILLFGDSNSWTFNFSNTSISQNKSALIFFALNNLFECQVDLEASNFSWSRISLHFSQVVNRFFC